MYIPVPEDAEDGGVRRRQGWRYQEPRRDDESTSRSSQEYSIVEQIPSHHRKLQLELHTLGTYGVRSDPSSLLPGTFDAGDYDATQHGLFDPLEEEHRAWKPWLSGNHGRMAKILVIFVTVSCHLTMVRLTGIMRYSTLCNIGPPALAIVSTKFLFFLTSQEQRRRTTGLFDYISLPETPLIPWHVMLKNVKNDFGRLHPRSGKKTRFSAMLKTAAIQFWKLLKRALSICLQWHVFFGTRTQNVLILILFAPLVSIPIRPAMQIVQEDVNVRARQAHCSDLSGLADYIGTQVPDGLYNAPDLWSLRNDASGTQPFTPPDLAWDWDWDDSYDARYAVYMPLFVPTDSLEHPLSIHLRTISQYVIVTSVRCQRARTRDVSFGNVLDGNYTLNLEVVDSDGCGATFQLQLESLSEDSRADIVRVLTSFARRINSSVPSSTQDSHYAAKAKLFLPRLSQYIKDAKESDLIGLVHPQWLPGVVQDVSANATVCQGKSILGMSAAPFLFADPDSLTAVIQATSCSTTFDLFQTRLSYRKDYWDESFLRHGQWPSQIQLSIEQDSERWQRSHLSQLNQYSQKYTSNANLILHERLSRMKVFDDWTPFRLIEEEYSAVFEQDPQGRAVINYGSDRLAYKIAHDLSFASATIGRNYRQECRRGYGFYFVSSYLQDRTLQNQNWFIQLFWFSTIWLIFTIIFADIYVANLSTGTPWEMCSIAARAALLRHSRLVECFARGRHLPESLRRLNPIRIGRWSSSQDVRPYLWRADSLLNACRVEPSKASVPRGIRHNLSSIPFFARPHVVFMLAGLSTVVVLNMYRIMVQSNQSGDLNELGAPLIAIMSMNRSESPSSSSQFFFLRMMPAMVFLSLTLCWWDLVTLFYKERLPWAELHHPNTADRTLTLEYRTATLPFIKALRNKHWMLAVFIIGFFAVSPLPILVSQLSNTAWIPREGGAIIAQRNFMWQNVSIETTNLVALRKAVRDTFSAWGDSSMLPPWTSFREALVPAVISNITTSNRNRSLPPGRAGYWIVGTESIRAQLECIPLSHKSLSSSESVLPPNLDTSFSLTAVLNGTGLSFQGSNVLNVSPCSHEQLDIEHEPTSTCSRWDLKVLGKENQTAGELAWIISSAHSDSLSVTTHVLLCQPQIATTTGTAGLLSISNDIRSASVHSYSPTSEAVLPVGLARNFSIMLNGSIFEPTRGADRWSPTMEKSVPRFDNPMVALPRFRGDILSLLSYRDMLRNGVSFDDSDRLANIASLIFSTIFAIFAQTSDALKVQTEEEPVSIVAMSWFQAFTCPPLVIGLFVATMGVLLFVMSSHMAVVTFKKKYRFPIAPEPLENSWFFLYRSSLIRIFEEEIEAPEKLTLSNFYRKVQQLGHMYVFKREDERDDWMESVVDVATTSGYAATHTSTWETAEPGQGYAQLEMGDTYIDHIHMGSLRSTY